MEEAEEEERGEKEGPLMKVTMEVWNHIKRLVDRLADCGL